jgi:ElaB/YqjD/DUF883 family membrane-anchored ribosome-binding protein
MGFPAGPDAEASGGVSKLTVFNSRRKEHFMEQTQSGSEQSTLDMENVAAARREVEALRKDIETLRGDLRNLYQSAKGAGKETLADAKSRVQETAQNLESWATNVYGTAQGQTHKIIEMSREHIQKRPFATVTGAVLAGMFIGRMRSKKQ